MRIAMLMATGWTLAALAMGCGGSDSEGGGSNNPGGGGAGNGGAGSDNDSGAGTDEGNGNGGNGGDGGGSTAGSCEVPQCILGLMAACIPGGACTSSTSGNIASGIVANNCFANGVKSMTSMTTGASGLSNEMTWYKADGSLCFTMDGTTDANGNATEYKDAAGNVVATATATLTDGKMTYSCDGQTFVVDPAQCADDGEDDDDGDGGSGCTPGACTVP